MNCFFKRALFASVFILAGSSGFSQYILNGSAQQNSCNCYTLTQASTFQSGSVWNSNKISLANPFDFWFNVFLGCSDGGADGIVFILQPLSTSIGSSGEGMGFGGVTPSIGIALDTYQNTNLNDPAYDHISIQANGVIHHSSDLAGPVRISSTSDNVEDCQWHKLRISWDPSTHWLRTYFDNVLRLEKQVDLTATIFNNDPNVFWGFTGGTGGAVNLQQFCTALDPDYSTGFSNNAICLGNSIQFTSHSESFAPITDYTWDFGDGQTSNAMDPPPHFYPVPGHYNVKLTIRGQDGCENDTIKKITVGSEPDAIMNVTDACAGAQPQLGFDTSGIGLQYKWLLDGTLLPGTQSPQLNGIPAGPHLLQLVASSPFGCGPDDTASANFIILAVPVIDFDRIQSCTSVQFHATQTDNATSISEWSWSFGDGQVSGTQDPLHIFPATGDFNVILKGRADNGCYSDTASMIIHTVPAYAFAGNDTVVVRDLPFQLHASGNGTFHWWPGTGLSEISIAQPSGQLSANQQYELTVETVEGCRAKDTINVKVFTGPAIYVPTAFSPNGDGLNDVLKPVYVGITRLDHFVIYNRWGQPVFSTSSMDASWDGHIGQKLQGAGSFVWMANGENLLHQRFIAKGTITIIK